MAKIKFAKCSDSSIYIQTNMIKILLRNGNGTDVVLITKCQGKKLYGKNLESTHLIFKEIIQFIEGLAVIQE